MSPRPLRIAHLFPDTLNIYGDIGNIRTLRRRAEWRGIGIELIDVFDGPADLTGVDLAFLGGGQDRDQALIAADLVEHKRDALVRAVDDGCAVLAVCGGYQLLGHRYLDPEGRAIPGIGLLDLVTEAGDDRWIGNVLLEADAQLGLEPATIVGFENHGGRTTLGPGVRPLGRVVVGGGNNGSDGDEGARRGRVVGTYVHGSLLPKNPALADWLLASALAHRDGLGEPPRLEPLDDSVEDAAHRRAESIALAERGRGPVRRHRTGSAA